MTKGALTLFYTECSNSFLALNTARELLKGAIAVEIETVVSTALIELYIKRYC